MLAEGAITNCDQAVEGNIGLTSQQVGLWREIMLRYEDDSERQKWLFKELVRAPREQIFPS